MSHAEEQYLRATSSANLKADEYHRDVYTLTAVGSSREGLAASLLRVRGEYDAIRGESNQATLQAQARELEAQRLEARATIEVAKSNRGPTLAQKYRGQAREVRDESQREMLVAHALIIVRLKTLRGAKLLLWNYVRQEAEANGLDELTWDQLDEIAGKVMQAFLSPRCPLCGGRGFNGGHREPTIHCVHCHLSGNVLINWGNEDFAEFGADILHRIALKVDYLRRRLARRTRDVAP